MLIFALIVALLITPMPAVADCTSKACIDVYVEDGKIVIDGKRNGVTSTPKPRQTRVKRSVKPEVTPTATKKATTNIPSYRPRTSTPRPKRSNKIQRGTPTLADKILQSLPTLQVAYQPEGAALIKVPVIFFTDLPSSFTKDIEILGELVKIKVKPRSLWNFGDGSILLTSKPGRPYPATDITHSYSVPGTYLVTVATIWSGTFTIAGITKEIPGAIRQVSAVDVKVVGASTKFVGK
ncbi:MAG: PKD domain-containing protein [Candidatus Nanopelagicaceae bacterium]